jgi:hypothetical protein
MQRGYFNERGVRQLLREHRNGTRDRSYELWHLLIFELWHRNFLERGAHVNALAWRNASTQVTMAGLSFASASKTAA